jgi:hypothetical protein
MLIPLSEKVVAYCHLIPEFVLMTLGRHCQMGDKSWSVFDALKIVPESPATKTLYVSLKLLPSLIRCLLIHGHYLPFTSHSEIQDFYKRRPLSSIREEITAAYFTIRLFFMDFTPLTLLVICTALSTAC